MALIPDVPISIKHDYSWRRYLNQCNLMYNITSWCSWSPINYKKEIPSNKHSLYTKQRVVPVKQRKIALVTQNFTRRITIYRRRCSLKLAILLTAAFWTGPWITKRVSGWLMTEWLSTDDGRGKKEKPLSDWLFSLKIFASKTLSIANRIQDKKHF